jgi:hypothetical protein
MIFNALAVQWAEGERRSSGTCNGAATLNDRFHVRCWLRRRSNFLKGRWWTYEVKWDGYLALAVKDDSDVRLISRNQEDLTRDYPRVVAAIRTREGFVIGDEQTADVRRTA